MVFVRKGAGYFWSVTNRETADGGGTDHYYFSLITHKTNNINQWSEVHWLMTIIQNTLAFAFDGLRIQGLGPSHEIIRQNGVVNTFPMQMRVRDTGTGYGLLVSHQTSQQYSKVKFSETQAIKSLRFVLFVCIHNKITTVSPSYVQ